MHIVRYLTISCDRDAFGCKICRTCIETYYFDAMGVKYSLGTFVIAKNEIQLTTAYKQFRVHRLSRRDKKRDPPG